LNELPISILRVLCYSFQNDYKTGFQREFPLTVFPSIQPKELQKFQRLEEHKITFPRRTSIGKVPDHFMAFKQRRFSIYSSLCYLKDKSQNGKERPVSKHVKEGKILILL
jgi:hypothetical protein